jgi:uncharacterized protein
LVEALLLFLAFFLPGFVGQASIAAAGPVSSLALWQTVIAGVPQILLMAYVVGARGPASSPRWGLVRFEPRDALRVAVLVAACFAVVMAFAALITLLPQEWSRSVTSGYRWGLRGPAQLPLALLVGLTAGYREELYFRAYLLKRMEEMGVDVPVSVVVSTALFCTGHLYEGVLGVTVALALGVVLAASYLKRRSLHVIAIAHALYNTLVLAVGLLAPRALPVGSAFRIFWS